MIKQKFKSCFLVVILSILFLFSMFAIVFLSSCSVKKTILSNDVNVVNDNLNLKKDYFLDPNGNVVSNNLLNPSNFANNDQSFTYINDSFVFTSVSGNNCFTGFRLSNYVLGATYTIQVGQVVNSGNAVFQVGVYNGGDLVLPVVLNTNGSITFTLPSNSTEFSIICYTKWVAGVGGYGTSSITNFMISQSSSVVSYEPYGIWYYGTNLNNPFYNSSLYYYFNMSISNYGYDIFLNDSLLNGNTFIYPYRAIQSKYSSEDLRAYVEDTQLGYWRLDFAKPYPVSMLNFKVLCTTTANFDYCITYYFNDGSNYVYHNSISSSLTEFIIDLSEVSNLSDKQCIYITWRRQSSYEINCLSIANYDLGYIDGSNDGYNKALKELDLDSYKTQINDLQQEITDLEYSLDQAQQRAQNSLDHLTYSMIGAVMSTPFNILHDYLNWNFFGINLFSLFTSLVTLLLIIWVIKFLLGRK